MKNRILASLLIVCMLLVMLPVTVAAEENVIEIYDKEDLIAFAEEADAGNNFAGRTVSLMADIDLDGEMWTPIASFAGNFVGNNKTIRNFHIDATSANGGFFNVIAGSDGLEDVKVKDLILSDVTATVGNNRFGTLANSVQGVVHNVTVKNVTVTTTHTGAWVGGMAAFMSWPWMTNCTVENLNVDASAGADLIGGFACILQKNSNHVFDNLDVNGFKVTITDTDPSGCGVGGFVTQTQRGWENPKVTNCDISGIDITASGLVDVGGFIAWPGAHTIAENCTTAGTINVTAVTSEDCFAGGFFGNLGWNADLGKMGHVVTDCSADVDIITKMAAAGGFVGSATNSNNNSMYATFNNCSASGDVSTVEGATADIGGFAGDADRGVYNSCSASGTITNSGTGNAGQFIGAFYDVSPKYDSRYPAGTRDYLVDVSTVEDCSYTGESAELSFIGYTTETADVSVVNNVACIGETKYDTLAKAFEAAKSGDTVELIKDVELTAGIEVDADVTFDLNGQIVSANTEDSDFEYMFLINHGATLKVKDSSEETTGKIDASESNVLVVFKMTKAGTDEDNEAELIIESGTFLAKNYIVSGNGNPGRGNTEVTVNDGVLTSTEGTVIYNPQSGTVTINGGKLTGETGIEMRSGELNVNDGTIIATGDPFDSSENGNGTTTVGAAVAVSQHTTNKKIVITIKGGEFKGARALYEEDLQDDETTGIEMSVIGGYFDGEVFSENIEKFISGGYYTQDVTDKCVDGYKAEQYNNDVYAIIPVESIFVTVAFITDPQNTEVGVYGYPVFDNGDGTFGLVDGQEYEYTVSADGYADKSGEFVAREGKEIYVILTDELPLEPETKQEIAIGTLTSIILIDELLEGDEPVMMPEKDVLTYGDALGMYQAELAASRFSDVSKSDWFYSDVTALISKGVINGYPDGSFRPQGEVTWGEALKLVMKAVGYGDIAATNGHWASGYMETAMDNLLISGEVDLDAAITREEVANLTAQALKLAPAEIEYPFDDAAPEAAVALYAAGIINGSADNGQLLFRAESTITRAEVSAIIWRVYCAR